MAYPDRSKLLTRADIERAMKNTLTNGAAARYLHVTYPTYKKYASLYKNDKGQTLYEQHFNRGAKGVPKFATSNAQGFREPALIDVIEGRVAATHFNAQRLKYKLITMGYLEPKCSCCGFDKKRPLDGKMPLILDHIDGDKNNWSLANLRFLCYNCSFMNNNPAITEAMVEKQEDFTDRNCQDDKVWELDPYQRDYLKSLGLPVEEEKKPYEQYISKL